MEDTSATSQPSLAKPATVSPQLIRQLPISVVVTLVVVAMISLVIVLLSGRADWWPALLGASVVATICAAASVVIILSSSGKPADYVITMIMLLAGVRTGISLIGLIVGVKALHLPAEALALMICGYYTAMLLVETLLVRRALTDAPDATHDTLRGNQG
jgi:hypothetical protein